MKSFTEWYEDPKNGVDRFEEMLAAIVAGQLVVVKPCDRQQVLLVLQDHVSLYSPYIAERTAKLIQTLEKQW